MTTSAMTLSSVGDGGLFTDRSFASVPVIDGEVTEDGDIPKLSLIASAAVKGQLDGVTEDEELVPPPNGRLTKSLVTHHLSDMGLAGDGTTYAYRNLELINLSLEDIGVLTTYQFIHHINLSNNNLTTLVVLSNMPWLNTLIASNNQIESLLDFTAPKALRHVDLSYNRIRVIPDLSEYVYIDSLILDHNEITMIGGLSNCRRIKELRLSHNRINKIGGLGKLPIQKLDLSYNQLTKIESIEGLEMLIDLDLSGNRIRSLQGIGSPNSMYRLDLSSNEIIDIGELDYLKTLYLLDIGEFSLNLSRNPLCELPDFRLRVLKTFPNLSNLNNKRVLTEERTNAQSILSPSLEQIAAVNHAMLTVYSFLQPAVLETYTLPDSEMSYPMLVIVGPDGSGREYLSMRLAHEYSNVFSVGPLCTSRPLFSDEVDGREFAHIPFEIFDQQVKSGQFMSIYNKGEHVYGFHKQSLDQAALQGAACVTHMELEGMLCLRKVTSLKPRYVLTVPLDNDVHDARLRSREVLSDEQVVEALESRQMHIKYHQLHSGLFDAVIGTDNLETAYDNLKQLVVEYLGRSPSSKLISQSVSVSAGGDAPSSDLGLTEQGSQVVKGLMSSGMIPTNDGSTSPTASITFGTERSLYRVRYEALQRVLTSSRKTSGLNELMGSKKERTSKSAGRSGVVKVAMPGGIRPTSHRSEIVQSKTMRQSNSAISLDKVTLKEDTGSDNDSPILAVDSSNRIFGEDNDRPASSSSRLGSGRFNVLPPIRSPDGN